MRMKAKKIEYCDCCGKEMVFEMEYETKCLDCNRGRGGEKYAPKNFDGCVKKLFDLIIQLFCQINKTETTGREIIEYVRKEQHIDILRRYLDEGVEGKLSVSDIIRDYAVYAYIRDLCGEIDLRLKQKEKVKK